MDTAKGLLGGNGGSPLDSLMGGQSAGSGFSSLLSGFTGGSKDSGSSSGLSSLLSSVTGGSKSSSSSSSGGLSSMLGGLFHEESKSGVAHKKTTNLRDHKHWFSQMLNLFHYSLNQILIHLRLKITFKGNTYFQILKYLSIKFPAIPKPLFLFWKSSWEANP